MEMIGLDGGSRKKGLKRSRGLGGSKGSKRSKSSIGWKYRSVEDFQPSLNFLDILVNASFSKTISLTVCPSLKEDNSKVTYQLFFS